MSCPTDVVRVRSLDGSETNVINTCSYNYLGYASPTFGYDKLVECLDKYGIGCCLQRSSADLEIILRLETEMKRFLGVDDVIVHTMGYDTNAMCIPYLVSEKSLVISDKFNHKSIVNGCQISGATVLTFDHRDMATIDRIYAQIDSASYDKVVVIVEGLYSMEGSFVDLKRLSEYKRKYGFLLFVDEAHSIGCLGRSGRGIREYTDCYDVDFCMGTFTKSFSSVGGYVGGRHDLIAALRSHAFFYNHRVGIAPMFAQQMLNVLADLDSENGRNKLAQLRQSSVYFRERLKAMGFHVYGDEESPVIPLVFYNPVKMMDIYRDMLSRKIAVVVVGFPAVPLMSARIRFCLSAAHTRDELDYVLAHVDQLGDYYGIKFGSRK